MESSAKRFPENVNVAVADPQLQRALGKMKTGFIDKRRNAIDKLPEFEELRDAAKAIKDHTLAHLDL